MEDKSFDIVGVGKIAKAIPATAWNQLVKTACTSFEKFMAPVFEISGGLGRLIEAKFDRLVEAEKILAAETLQKATLKVSMAGKQIGKKCKPNIILRVIEESAKQTDVNIRELWANLLAQEMITGEIHPEIVRKFSRLSAQDAQCLVVYVNNKKPFNLNLKHFVESLRAFSLEEVFSEEKNAFSKAFLIELNLLGHYHDSLKLTPIGEEFIKSVTDPSLIKNKK